MTSAAHMVDWDLAVTTATKLMRPGPEVTRDEAHAAVAELRRGAVDAEHHVREFTRLNASSRTAPVLVIDRPGWVRANIDGFRVILQPLTEKLSSRRSGSGGADVFGGVGAKLTGIEVGALLAFLGSRVLGQFETFSPSAGNTGRLLLVAPNIVQVERELDVDPRDFRLWVCLHEETHRSQFTAVPWLRDHLEGEIQAFLTETEVDPLALIRRVRETMQGAAGRSRNGDFSLFDLVQTPNQRDILSRLTAVMSLLEGHADYVMDGVGPSVIPSVADIRGKFQQRRSQGTSRLDTMLRRLLGLDAKMRQYRDGEHFVRTVVDRVGIAGFNRIWTSPNTLPTKSEIADPEAWVARVHRAAREG